MIHISSESKEKLSKNQTEIEQNPIETEGDLHLVQYRTHGKHFTKTDCYASKYIIPEFQDHLQTKSDLRMYFNMSESIEKAHFNMGHPVYTEILFFI